MQNEIDEKLMTTQNHTCRNVKQMIPWAGLVCAFITLLCNTLCSLTCLQDFLGPEIWFWPLRWQLFWGGVILAGTGLFLTALPIRGMEKCRTLFYIVLAINGAFVLLQSVGTWFLFENNPVCAIADSEAWELIIPWISILLLLVFSLVKKETAAKKQS